MKHSVLAYLAVDVAVIACTKPGEQMTMPSFGPYPVPSPTDDNGYVVINIPSGETLSWKAGDVISVESSAGVESYTLIPGSSAVKGVFRGKALSGTSFNILIPGPQTSYEAIVSADYSQQTQAANEDDSHIQSLYALKGINTLSDITLSSEWAESHGGHFYKTGKMTVDLTVPRAMTALSSVSVSSSSTAFGSYTVALPDLDMKLLKHRVRVFVQLPLTAVEAAAGDVLSFTLQGGNLTATRSVTLTDAMAGASPVLSLDDKDWTGEGIVFTLPGSGTVEDPYLLESAEDMMIIPDKLVENAETPVYFQLESDIDMKDIEWTPLVTANAVYPIDFNGAGFSISNLTVSGDVKFPSFVGVLAGAVHNVVFDKPVIKSSNVSETGVVAGWAGRSAGDITANIYGVSVKDAVITMPGNAPVGLIAGQGMKVTIRDCQVTGSIENGVSCSGGILGNIALADDGSIIENCSFTGSIQLPSAGDYNGGIVGAVRKGAKNITVKGCKVVADITSGTTKGYIGGIMGANWNGNSNVLIEACSYSGTIKTNASGNGGSGLAGICGYTQEVVIRNCWSSGEITQCNYGIGGIAGTVFQNVTIENCFTSMKLHSRHGAGGIAGRADNNANASDVNTGYNDSFIKCLAWNPSITSRLDPGIAAGNLSSGAIVGKCVSKNIHKGCVRRADMVFDNYADAQYDVLFDQPDNDATGTLYIPKSLGQYYWPYHGTVAPSGKTASAIAKEMGWDTAVWDLSGNEPKLK